jgi:hypothetical protein
MINKMAIFLISAILTISTIHCNYINTKSQSDKLKDIVSDIPYNRKGTIKYIYYEKLKIEKMLNLERLEDGFDSIQIRLWYGHSFTDSFQLVILKKSNSIWNASLYSSKYSYNTKRDSIDSIETKVEEKLPKSGWPIFVEKLFTLDIATLPDSGTIPGYADCADGDGIMIEVATKELYRIYSYTCITHSRDIWQVSNMDRILKTMEEELNFKRVEPVRHR